MNGVGAPKPIPRGRKRSDVADIVVELDNSDIPPTFLDLQPSSPKLSSASNRRARPGGERSVSLDVGQSRREYDSRLIPQMNHRAKVLFPRGYVHEGRCIEIELQNSTPRRIAITMSERLGPGGSFGSFEMSIGCFARFAGVIVPCRIRRS